MANTNAPLLMNGIDHAEAEPLIPQIIARANETLENVTIRHSRLSDHLAQVRASGKELADFAGDFHLGVWLYQALCAASSGNG
jgi:hypothetical protein